MFGGKYITAEVLNGNDELQKPLVFESIIMEEVDKEQKVVAHFVNTEEVSVLNKTNFLSISKELGTESDNWIGSSVVFHTQDVMYENKLTPAVRVKEVIKKT